MWQKHFLIICFLILSSRPWGSAQETEWNWSKCKERRITNGFAPGVQLHRLSTAGGDGDWSVSEIMTSVWRAVNGNEPLRYWNLRGAFNGDGAAYIIISREKPLDFEHGLYFLIGMYKREAYLFVREKRLKEYNVLKTVPLDIDLSYSQDTPFTVTISDGTLELRVGNLSTPLLAVQDQRYSQMQFFGYNTYYNTRGYATFKYGC